MPLGFSFGAVFCAGFSCWLGARLVAQQGGAALGAGVCLAVCGVSLALGLLRRRTWARGGAIALACVFAWVGLRLSGQQDGVSDHLLLLSSLTAAVLLAVPATGDPRRGRPAAAPAAGSRRKPLAGAAALGALGAVGFAAAWWAAAGVPAARTAGRPETNIPAATAPAPAPARIEWSSGLAAGMTRARSEGRSLLVTFFTDWCPYCKKMAGTTWKSAEVARRLRDVVAVRLNAEDGGEGSAAAERYGVEGYPLQLLLDGQGRVIARADGYQTSSEFTAWLDRALGPAGSPSGNLITKSR